MIPVSRFPRRQTTWPRSRREVRGLGTLSLLSALAWPATAFGQGERLDVGSFTIRRDGQRIGREQFSLRRAPSPDGGVYELRAEASLGDRRTASRLETDSSGTPVRYAVEVRDGTVTTIRLGGQRVRGRFATLARGTRGEAAREYMLAPGAIVLDNNAYHQSIFLVRGRRAGVGARATVSAFAPLDNAQRDLQLTLEAVDDRVSIAGNSRPARRWRVVEPSGLARLLWADDEGRILRILIPAQAIEVLRDDIPR
jgi:hypothetical protein